VREVRLDSLEKILIAERFLLDEAPAAHYRLHSVAMRSLKASISESINSRIRTRSMPALQKDAAWRAVTASKKFVAYERQSSSL
jgi:hypothetical protein